MRSLPFCFSTVRLIIIKIITVIATLQSTLCNPITAVRMRLVKTTLQHCPRDRRSPYFKLCWTELVHWIGRHIMVLLSNRGINGHRGYLSEVTFFICIVFSSTKCVIHFYFTSSVEEATVGEQI